MVYMNWSFGILAGGKSSRFGEEKALYSWKGKPLIQHVLDQIDLPAYISANDPEYDRFGTRVPDLWNQPCPLIGILSLLKMIPTERLFVCGCDMPLISQPLVDYLHTFEGDLILPVSSDGEQPLHAIYSKNAIPAIEQALQSGSRSATAFAHQVNTVRVPIKETEWKNPFLNINCLEDFPS